MVSRPYESVLRICRERASAPDVPHVLSNTCTSKKHPHFGLPNRSLLAEAIVASKGQAARLEISQADPEVGSRARFLLFAALAARRQRGTPKFSRWQNYGAMDMTLQPAAVYAQAA
jgi:hypothetical protein